MMQVSKFHDGSFVAHKVTLDGIASRFSLWASPLGILRDAERIDARGRSYTVPRGSRAWARLAVRAESVVAIRAGF